MPTEPTKRRTSALAAARRSSAPVCIRTQFYLEELLKHWQCLEDQRDCYSEGAMQDIETALHRVLTQLEQLSGTDDADQVIGRLLRKFDVLTGLSHWTDPKTLH